MTTRTRFALVSFLLALLAGAFVTFAPLVARCSINSIGAVDPCVHRSLFQTDGVEVPMMLSVPIALTLLPVLLRRRSAVVVSAILLWAICVVGVASLALFFVPAAIAMTIAATRRDPVPASV